MYNDYGAGCTIGVQTSTDGGTNWTTEWSYASGGGDIAATTTAIALTNYGASTLIAWWTDGNHYQYDYWYVDDVVVQDGAPVMPGLWTGAIDTDWGVKDNWDDGNVPDATVAVTIPAGCPNYPYITGITAQCLSLTIQNGGGVYMVDSFFDIFVDISLDGELQIDGGIVDVTGNLNGTSNGLLDMNGGTLNIGGGIYESGSFTWASSDFELSGGTINVTNHAAFYGGVGTMNGPFNMYVGGSVHMGTDVFTTVTGGTITLTGTAGTPQYFLPPTGTGTGAAYNLVVNAAGATYIFSRDATTNGDHIYNNFTVVNGTVQLQSSLETGSPGTFTVDGDVSVKPGASFDCIVSTLFSVAGNLVLEADATGYSSWIDNEHVAVAKGLQQAQVAYNGVRWHMISSPIPNAVSGLFTGLYLQRHDETTNAWTDIISTTDPLNVGQGYALYNTVAGTHKALFDGSFNTGIQALTLTDNSQGWNAVGNPYPSAIDWDAALGWTKTNVADATYVENNGLWASYIAGVGTNGGNQFIAPGQGFFVECTGGGGGGALGMTKDIRTLDKPAYLKDSDPQLVRLQVQGNKRTDESVIRFNENATAGFDYNFDARKFFATEESIPEIWSSDNGGMSINTLPSTEMVALSFKCNVGGFYTISATETGEFAMVELEDLVTGTFTDLLKESYTFKHELLNSENRFVVHFKPLFVGENFADMINIYSDNHVVYVSVPAQTTGSVKVYNLLGQEAASTVITDLITRITLDNSAYYIIEVISDGSVVTKKVFVK
jgi:hypothetical protein